MILLDTHIWLWWLLGDGALNSKQREELDRLASERQLAISWVSLWETEMLEAKGRIRLLPGFESWLKKATDRAICRVLPVDLEVVLAQRRLPATFHSDPADRLITATALLAECPLATFDDKIKKSEVAEIWEWKSSSD